MQNKAFIENAGTQFLIDITPKTFVIKVLTVMLVH